MEVQEILVCKRSDLTFSIKDKKIEDIGIDDFNGSIKPFHTNPFSIFIDDDGRTKLLKNRYGNDGLVKTN